MFFSTPCKLSRIPTREGKPDFVDNSRERRAAESSEQREARSDKGSQA